MSRISHKKLIVAALLFIIAATSFCLLWVFRRGTLQIEAQIIYNMGGAQPVARQKFYLLNANPQTLRFDDPKIRERLDLLNDEEEQLVIMSGALLLALNDGIRRNAIQVGQERVFLGVLERSRPFWEAYLVAETQTDFQGRATIENLRPGKYWVVGMTETRAAFAYWSIEVDIHRGTNELILDQNNALYSK